MAQIIKERMTAETNEEFVVFLVGMRINKLWKIHKFHLYILGFQSHGFCFPWLVNILILLVICCFYSRGFLFIVFFLSRLLMV
jgi:hypothetical protein